ncbi:MAG: hypothetical protein AABZ60_15600, partial [Planctomycetota bacterium]
MRPISFPSQKRFTMVEVGISLVISVIILGATFSIFTTSQNFFYSESTVLVSHESTRITMNKLVSELNETSLLTVDTVFRPNGIHLWANDFKETTPGNKHCTSNTNLFPGSAQSHAAWSYSLDPGDLSVTEYHGRHWFNFQGNLCPIHGDFLANDAYLDGVKFFSPRNKDGFLMLNAKGFMDWQSIVFYFPYRAAGASTFELRRYEVFLSDMFDPNPGVTLLSLWDFNEDGRVDDGEDFLFPGYDPIPEAGISDRFEVFSDSIRWLKVQGTKKNELVINRATGDTTWILENVKGFTETKTFIKPPRTIAYGLFDIEISTQKSNPYDEFAYPEGVKNLVTRISL